MATLRRVRTPTLEIAYEESGASGGFPIVLLHGFPDDARAWDGVVGPFAGAGHRVLVPYLRGYGPTRFLDAEAPRMAQQAAIGQDLLDFLDALALPAGVQVLHVERTHWAGDRPVETSDIVIPGDRFRLVYSHPLHP